MLAKTWTSSSHVKRFTRTADYYYRHAYDPAKHPPKHPMSIEDAAEMIRYLVEQTLKEKSLSRHSRRNPLDLED